MRIEAREYRIQARKPYRGFIQVLLSLFAGSLSMMAGADVDALLSRLDLSRPELATVKHAVDAGDSAAAAAALLSHFRARETPRWYTDPPPAPDVDQAATLPAAEKVLRREYAFVGKPATLTRDIDWNANPLQDHEWPIELNRHYTWVRLVDGYHQTGNPAYARDLIAQLRDWVEENPRPPSPRQARYTWRTLECGIRLSGSWPRCYVGLLNSPLFTPEVLCLMLEAMWQQADYLTQYHGGGNWLITETAGLMTMGVLFPEFADAADWRSLAFERLEREIDRQVLPDGAQVELTPHYHSVTMGSFISATRIAQHNGIDIPGNVTAGIDRMARYLMDVSKPDLHIPMFNDSDHDNVTRRLRPFADDEHPAMRFVLSRGKEGRAPEYTSIALPYAGQIIMRSGWDEQAHYLAMDAGPYGYGHQHEDKLQIDVHALGRSHILDPGRFTYAGGPWRRYFLSTQAHSTLLVNGQGQNRRNSPRRRWVSRHPQDTLWVTNDTFDAAIGVYQDGYHGGYHDLIHIRKIFFKRGEYWIVLDALVGPEGATEDIAASIQYQFATPGVTVQDGGSVIQSHNDDANLALLPVSDQPFQVALHEGEEDPPRGWIGWSLHKALKTPATLAVIQQEAALPMRVDTLLWPYRGNEMPAVRLRRLEQDSETSSALEVVGPTWRDQIRWSHDHMGAGDADLQTAPPLIDYVRYDEEGREIEQAHVYSAASAGWSADPDTPPETLAVVPSLRSLEVTIPVAGRLQVSYGFLAGGGYLFHQDLQGQPGSQTVALPSIRAGSAYQFAVRLIAEGGTHWLSTGSYKPEPVAGFDFEEGVLGEWSGGEIEHEQGNAFLRGRGRMARDPVYISIRHPLPRLKGDDVMLDLRLRMPFADGGDWCYGKVALTDTEKRTWSAYVASNPVQQWRTLRLQREDFRRDDGGEGGDGPLPRDAVVLMLAVTVRKGTTAEPEAPILDIDDVSWTESP